jgi:hypothetical protein
MRIVLNGPTLQAEWISQPQRDEKDSSSDLYLGVSTPLSSKVLHRSRHLQPPRTCHCHGLVHFTAPSLPTSTRTSSREPTPKMVENPTENLGSKRAINCRKPNETGAFMGIGPKTLPAGNAEKRTRKTPINKELKIQNGILYRGQSATGT